LGLEREGTEAHVDKRKEGEELTWARAAAIGAGLVACTPLLRRNGTAGLPRRLRCDRAISAKRGRRCRTCLRRGGDRSGASVAALPAQSDGTRHPSVSRETNPRSSARLDLQADQALFFLNLKAGALPHHIRRRKRVVTYFVIT